MNALDGALASLIEAQNYLEKDRPTVAEVEKAKDAAKDAADILKAAHALLEAGYFDVAKPPVDKFNDPADYKIEMPEPVAAAPTPAAVLPPLPDLFLAGFLEADEAGQRTAFESALEDLDAAGAEDNPDDASDWDDQPWWAEFDRDRAAAWQKLIFATHHRQPFAFTVPTDEEFDAWVGQHAIPLDAGQVEVPAALTEPASEEPAAPAQDSLGQQLAEFNAGLDRLEEAGVKDSLLKRKAWPKADKAWHHAFAEDHAKASRKLAWALDRHVITWDVPTDEEIAPAEPTPAVEPPADDPFDSQEGGAQ